MGNTISIRIVLLGLAIAVASGCASTKYGGRDQVFRDPLDHMVITSSYGARNGRPHNGMDLSAKKGTAVKATARGEVLFAGRQRGFGRLVIVQHVSGYQSYYAHLSKITVRKGAAVEAGERVGKVGKSGNATGHHLHFEIRKDGRPMNPATVLGRSPAQLAP